MSASTTSTVESSRWQTRAACRGLDPQLFFPAQGESPAAAKAVCATCSVRVQCATAATFDRAERHGVWGGLTERDRRRLRQSRRRQQAPEGVV